MPDPMLRVPVNPLTMPVKRVQEEVLPLRFQTPVPLTVGVQFPVGAAVTAKMPAEPMLMPLVLGMRAALETSKVPPVMEVVPE
jgi:hypothetical protein